VSSLTRAMARLAASVAMVAVAAPAWWSVGPRDADAAGIGLKLISAPLVVAPDQVTEVDLDLRGVSGPPNEVDVSVRPLPSDPVRFETDLARADLRPSDTIRLGSRALTLSGSVLTLHVPTQARGNRRDRLALPEAGPYALTVSIPGTSAAVTLPIIRSSDSHLPRIPVAVVVGVDAPLSIQPDASISVAPAARAAIAALSRFLAAVSVPVSVWVRPELLSSLATSGMADDATLVVDLVQALGSQRLLAVPYVHLDPSVAAASGLVADFTTQLRRGEDALHSALQRLSDRRVWVATDPLSPAGAALVRNLGADVIVTTAGVARDPAGTAAAGAVPVVAADGRVARLYHSSADPVLSAQILGSELVLTHRGVDDPGVVLNPDLGSLDPASATALMRLISTSSVLTGVDIEQLGPGTALSVPAQAGAVDGLGPAMARRSALALRAAAASALLPASDPRIPAWGEVLTALLDSRLAAPVRAEYEQQLAASVSAVVNNVVLRTPGTVNLGDRNSNIPVTIRNDNDVAVTVEVRLSSAKLRFPQTSSPVTVAPHQSVFMRIPVVARTNGLFPVTAQLLTPAGTQVVGRTVTLSVRVGRLTGLGIVLTFALGLALVTWWVQHLRRRWRQRLATEDAALDPTVELSTGLPPASEGDANRYGAPS